MVLSEAELQRWGRAIGGKVSPPVFIALRGELGAGKSVLARAVARGAGVEGTLPSPTFNLCFRYPSGRDVEVVHMDLYRLTDPDEVWELGWAEIVAGDGIVLVEWPERAGDHLPETRWEVSLRPVQGDPLGRIVEATRVGHPPDLPTFPLTVDAGGAGG